MKTIGTLLAVLLLAIAVQAKTYTISSGKWSDPLLWGNQYIGSTIKEGDVVIITGQITMTTLLIVEGTLQIENGATLMGMKDLTIIKSGKFVNNGNTVVRRILNEGSISNNLMMEAITDIENKSTIENNNNILAGNNFENEGGNAYGRGGRFYVNNIASYSAAPDFSAGVNIYSTIGTEDKLATSSVR